MGIAALHPSTVLRIAQICSWKNQFAALSSLDTTSASLKSDETGEFKCCLHLRSTSPYGA